MPRQRTHHGRTIYDFPRRLVRFKEASEMTWDENRLAARNHHRHPVAMAQRGDQA